MDGMDTLGNDISSGGVVLSKSDLLKRRERNGQCLTCGNKLFQKKLFKMIPLTIPGKVLDGRCLSCNPLDPNKGEELVASCAVVAAPPTRGASGRDLTRGMSSRSGGRSRQGRPPSMAASMPVAEGHRVAAAMSHQPSISEESNNSSSSRDVRNFDRSRSMGEAAGNSAKSKFKHAKNMLHAAKQLRASKIATSSIPDLNNMDADSIVDDNSDFSSDESLSKKLGESSSKYSKSSNEPGGKNFSRQGSMERARLQNSSRRDSFLQRQVPRPSAIIDSNMLANLDLSDDDSSDYDVDPIGNSYRESMKSVSTLGLDTLTKDERDAIDALSSNDNSFTDIINIMMVNSISPTVQNEGLHALSLIHDPPVEVLDEVAESCGFEIIVSAMGSVSQDAMAQTNACKVLFIASSFGQNHQVAIGTAGGVEALGDAMKFFEEDMIVLEGCLLALSNLCIPRENMRSVLNGDIIELTVSAMSKSVDNCGLQEHGCAVLANLAVHGDARVKIRNCGGCDTIVVSMVVNPMDVEVQLQALVALRNLCVRDDENKVVLAEAGGIDAVIGAMQAHRDEPKIQERGSWVLSILGMNEDNKVYIGENGGADVIIRSMWVHPDDAGVQEKACRALWTLSVHPDNKYLMVEVGAIAGVVNAMQSHADEASIQEKGCGVLSNLAANDDQLKVQIVEENALDVVVMAMVLHGENGTLQERACTLLKKLCIPKNIASMAAANVVPILAVVAETNPKAQKKANYVLSKLKDS